MSEEKRNRIFTAADIEKYHKGLLSAKEMHEMEKAALEDPFLADALEGYGSVSVDATADLTELQQKLQQRVSSTRVVAIPARNLFKWWRVAAAVVILGGIGFLTFKLSTSKNENSIAELKKKKQDGPPAMVNIDSNKLTTFDSTSFTKNKQPTETLSTLNSTKKFPTRVSTRKADTTDFIAGSEGIRTSAASEVAKYEEQKIDSNEKSGLVTQMAAPVTLKKAEPRAAQPEGVLNEQQTARAQSQMNHFTGRVVDASSNAIPFANITTTRSNLGTYADARGYFSLNAPDSVLSVRVRSVGFENELTELKNYTYNQVMLQDDKTAPDKILAFQNSDFNRSRAPNMQVEQPEPVDGWTNYNRYMANNVNVPDDLKISRDNDRVQVSFDVNDNGEPENVKVEKSLCKKCDEEAIRLVKQGPKWKQNKKSKRAMLAVPFHKK